MDNVVNATIIVKNDTAANFASKNPVLRSGEQAFETDTNKMKIGNGTNNYNDLAYIGGGAVSVAKKIYMGSTFPSGSTVLMFIKEES